MNRLLGLLAVVVLLAAASAQEDKPNPLVGINLAGISYWSTEIPFVDVFRASQPFISQAKGRSYGKGDPLELREDGYPKQLAAEHWADSIVLGNDAKYKGGEYVCLYEGKGKVELASDAKMTKQEPGRIEAAVTPKHHISVKISATDPADPIRNIRLMRKEFEAAAAQRPFDPDFLKLWSNMKVLRFMDWMQTNGSKIATWNGRPKLADQTWQTKGVPVEAMVELANTLKADPWFCMPHLADDDYVRSFAKLVKEKLAPDRKVYIEYSNETWNFIFAQTRYCVEQGKKLKLSDNEYQGGLRYHAQRATEIFAIWEEVFGGHDRLVRVLASHTANKWASEQIVTWKDAYKKADALAIAPYFGHAFGDPKKADETTKLTVQQILEGCRPAMTKVFGEMKQQAELAKKHNLKLVAYEAGQHLVGYGGAENNQKLMELLIAANRDPLMKDLYRDYFRGWKDAGGDLLMVFSSTGRPSKWGSWGALESQTQDPATAPKYQAVQEFIGGK